MITLENVLANNFGDYAYFDESKSADAYMSECFELVAEGTEIVANIMMFEAAKRIKASKSKKKKVKVKKTKTTAKKARSAKRAGKRIRREEDDVEADDANGISSNVPVGDVSEQTLDNMPDNAQVTEIEPDPNDSGVETESTHVGSDEMIIYEDASILAFEEEKTKQRSKFTAWWVKMWRKFVDWWKKMVRNVAEFFKGDEKLIKNAKNFERNITSTQTKVTVNKLQMKPADVLAEFQKVFKTLIDSLKTADKPGNISAFGIDISDIESDDVKEKIFEKIYGSKEPEAKEMTLAEAAANVGTKDELKNYLVNAVKMFDDSFSQIGRVKSDEVWNRKNNGDDEGRDDHVAAIKDKAKQLSKFTSIMWQTYKTIRTDVRKIIAAAGEVKESEFKTDGEKKEEKK